MPRRDRPMAQAPDRRDVNGRCLLAALLVVSGAACATTAPARSTPARVVAPVSQAPATGPRGPWSPPLEVVVEELHHGEPRLRSLGRALEAARAEVGSATWWLRTRSCPPELVELLSREAVPGLWLTHATDADLERLVALPIADLSLHGAVTPAGLASFCRAAPAVRRLTLESRTLWEGGHASLAALPALESLSLWAASAGELAALERAPALARLSVPAWVLGPGGEGVATIVSLAARLDRLELTDWDPDAPFEERDRHRPVLRLERGASPDALEAGLRTFAGLRAIAGPGGFGRIPAGWGAALSELAGLTLLELPDVTFDEDEFARLARAPALATLRLRGRDVTRSGLEALRAAPQLRRLELRPAPTAEASEGLAALERLESLFLDGNGARLAALAALPRLRWLTLDRRGLDEAAAVELAGLRQLESLELRCEWLPELVALRLASCPLERLAIEGPALPAALGRLLGPLRSLERLRLYAPQLEGPELAGLEQLPSLREVDLSFDRALRDGALAPLVRMPWLRRVSIVGSELIGGAAIEGLEAAAPRCFVADDLAHDDYRPDTDADLERLARLAPDQEALWLRPWRTERTYAAVARLRGIRELGLPDEVTGAELAKLGPLPALEALHLGGCARLAPADLRGLGQLERLTTLDLSRTWVDGPALEALAARGRLTSLRLAECALVRDAALEPVGRCAVLERLDLSGCAHVTDRGLDALHGLARLRWLDLTNVRGVTADGVARLRSALPACHMAYTDPAQVFAGREAVAAAFDGPASWFDLEWPDRHWGPSHPAWFRGLGWPLHPTALPVEDDTVRAGLAVAPVGTEVELKVTVRAAHPVEKNFTFGRYSYLTAPAVFALSLDGAPLSAGAPVPGPSPQWYQGSAWLWLRDDVPGPGEVVWTRRVPAERLTQLLPAGRAGRVAIVAAVADAPVEALATTPWSASIARVLVRTEAVHLVWDGSTLRAP